MSGQPTITMTTQFSLSVCFLSCLSRRRRNAWHLPGGEGGLENTTSRRVLATRADGSQTIEEVKGAAGMGRADKKAMLESLRSQVSVFFGSWLLSVSCNNSLLLWCLVPLGLDRVYLSSGAPMTPAVARFYW